MPPRPMGQVGQTNSPEDWFNSLPIITRYWLVSALGSTVLISMGMLDPMSIILDWRMIWNKFQIWRFFSSAVFFGGFSFNYMMQLYMLVSYSQRYESDALNSGGGGGSSDFAFMLCIGIFLLSVFGYYMRMILIGQPLIYMIMYVWSQKNYMETVSLFFGIKIQAIYLPWAMTALQVLMGASPIPSLMGILVGHIYYFLLELVPSKYGTDIIRCPMFMINLFGHGRSGFTATPPPQQRAQGGGFAAPGRVNPPGSTGVMGGYNWGGGGQRLGTN